MFGTASEAKEHDNQLLLNRLCLDVVAGEKCVHSPHDMSKALPATACQIWHSAVMKDGQTLLPKDQGYAGQKTVKQECLIVILA